MMKLITRVLTFLLTVTVLGVAVSVMGGPLVRIDSVDARSDFPTVNMTVTVRNPDSSSIHGLTEEHLMVYEDGYRVNYVNVKDLSDDARPVYLMMAVDSSKSISKEWHSVLKKAAGRVVDDAGSLVQIALYRFNDKVQFLNNFTRNREQIKEKIAGISRHGKYTHLYDCIYDSLNMLSEVENTRRAVVVFTDGKDDGSSLTPDDIIQFARDSEVPVFFVMPDKDARTKNPARIARMTGGKMITISSNANIGSLYTDLVRTIVNRYSIKYKTMAGANGTAHQVEVRLKHGQLRDRDVQKVTYDSGFLNIALPGLSTIILIILVFLLLVVLGVLCAVLFKRGREKMASVQPYIVTSKTQADYRKLFREEEARKMKQDVLLTPEDPEYSYAKAWLVEKGGPETGKKFPLFWDEITLGRDPECTIVIKDDAVSLKHARIKKMFNGYYLFDMASDNGTFLNGRKLLRPRALYDWDEIKMGRSMFLFRGSKG